MIEAVEHIRRVAREAGKIAGIVSSNEQATIQRIEQGFNMVTCGSDSLMLTRTSRQALATVREHLQGRQSL